MELNFNNLYYLNLKKKIDDILFIIDNYEENDAIVELNNLDDEGKSILTLLYKYNKFITDNNTTYLEYKSNKTEFNQNSYLKVDDNHNIQNEFLIESIYKELVIPIINRNDKLTKVRHLPWPDYHVKPNI
jgi:hypothetical protein